MGVSASDFWGPINDAGADFWANLELYPWFDELMLLVRANCDNYTLSTSPSLCPGSYAGKRRWISKHFGEGFTGCMLGSRKWLMAGPGRILIDDNDTNCEKFRQHGGQAILFPAIWNSHHHLVGERMEYVEDELREITEAYERLTYGG